MSDAYFVKSHEPFSACSLRKSWLKEEHYAQPTMEIVLVAADIERIPQP